jgi:hypothetical protein
MAKKSTIDTSKLNQIDVYTHDDKTRANIPPVWNFLECEMTTRIEPHFNTANKIRSTGDMPTWLTVKQTPRAAPKIPHQPLRF